MHPDVEKLVSAGRISEAVGQKLSTLSPDSHVLHGSWGAGKITSWDLFGGKVTIDFEKSKEQTMGLKLALQKLTILEPGDVRITRLSSLGELKELALKDPAELVVKVLSAHGGKMKPDQLDDELSGTIVETAVYKKWWDKAKKALRESKRAHVPTKRTDYISLRDQNESPLASLMEEFQEARNLKAKIKILDTIKSEGAALIKENEVLSLIVSEVDEISRRSLKLQAGHTLELLCARDEIVDLVEDYELPEDSYQIRDALLDYTGTLSAETSSLASVRQRRIYDAFPEAYGEDWVKKILTIFESIGTRGVAEIAKILDEHDKSKALHAHIKKALSRRSLGPDALSWICRERNKAAQKSFGHEVGMAVLNTIESDYLEDGPRKSNRLQAQVMEDRELITDFVEGIDPNDIKNFSKKLLSSPAFPDLDRKSLMARIIKSYPEVADLLSDTVTKRDTSLIVSWKSLERKREEYKDLIENRIPQNIKDISIARSYGDLRENFEYKAAKDMQAVLNRRKGEVEMELNRAKGTDFENVNTDSVTVGTVLTLKGEDGKKSVYSILGAWDGDPDNNVVSYKSEVAKGLMGKKVGAKVDVQDFDGDHTSSYVIEKIEAFNKG